MPHSEKSLFQLVSFRIALWAPISIAILFSVYIFITSDLTFQTGFVGLNNAWDIFKIPLALFSLVFPSVALVAANHRSIQSKKQIDLNECSGFELVGERVGAQSNTIKIRRIRHC